MKSFSLRPLSRPLLALFGILVIAALLRLVNLAQIPPGLYHDEAVNGLDIWNILTGQRAPIFFEANGGREPLFLYLQALSVWLFGPTAWALRIVSAIIGIATVAVFFLVAREMSPTRFHANTFALVASAGLATSYWHLHWSRVGLRAILLPLLLCAALYFFLVARRTLRARHAILAGIFLGLSFYSYLAARLAPVLFITLLALDWQATKKALWRNALFFATALVVALPLILYFVVTPAAFTGRAGDIALSTDSNTPLSQSLALNTARVAGMFFIRGDVEWRHGLALRPVLDPISAALFVLGLAVSFAYRREFSARLAWLWLVIMLLPTVLSQQAPDTLRAIGAVPVVYWFVALGWSQLSEWFKTRIGGAYAAWTGAGIAVLLLGSGFFTARDYLYSWANDPRAYRDFDGEFTEIAAWINAQAQPVYVPAEIYSYPTVQFLTLARGGAVSSILDKKTKALAQGGIALMTASRDPRAQYVLLADHETIMLDPVPVPALDLNETINGRYRPLTGIAPVADKTFFVSSTPNITPLDAQFGGINLVGFQLDTRELSPSQPFGFNLYWQRAGAVPHEPKVFVQIMDANGQEVARADKFPTNEVSVARYPLGQTVPDRYFLTLDHSLAPGRYALWVGLLDPLTGERWDVSTAGGGDDHVALAWLRVPLPFTPLPADAAKISARWQNGITLAGYTTDTQTPRAGESSEWTAYWRTEQPLSQDETIFVQLLNAQGEIVAQADHDPMQGAYPTTIWQTGEIVPDTFSLVLPAALPAGDYKLDIGWYNRATNQRVALASPPTSDNALPLRVVTVR